MQNKYTCIDCAHYNDNSLDNLLKIISLHNKQESGYVVVKN